ncbi:hypothetical protein ACK83N_005034, partial [Salmonella enterica]
GNSTKDGSAKVMAGQGLNISLNGGNFTLAGAGGSNVSFTAPHGDGGTITAGNIAITALGNQGVDLIGLSLNATAGDLTVNASKVSSQSGWGHDVTWSAAGNLSVVSEKNVSFSASNNESGGGKTALSGNKGVNITSTSGSVTASIGGNNKNAVNVSSSEGDVALTAGGGNLNVAKVNISAANATTLNASG